MLKPAVDTRDERILSALRRIGRAIDLHSRDLARRYSLTVPQLLCLRELARSGPMLSGRLAEKVSLSRSTVTGILDRLEHRDLVLRLRGETDKRQVSVHLTEAGELLVEETPLPLSERFRRRLARLAEEDQARVEEVLLQVVEMMEARELEAAPMLASGPATAVSETIETFLAPESEEPGSDGSGL